ncbi:hypothetical protein E4U43_001114 [Claviceps pusilla]|uniref:Uncharacterized protein n=1 Tax=Claviceps pusilla TaxID=123648 RepID=A0A9P7N930_9HYPO|nr:hypothetical protein E4U43_001114 [Claviceps pusilla]
MALSDVEGLQDKTGKVATDRFLEPIMAMTGQPLLSSSSDPEGGAHITSIPSFLGTFIEGNSWAKSVDLARPTGNVPIFEMTCFENQFMAKHRPWLHSSKISVD